MPWKEHNLKTHTAQKLLAAAVVALGLVGGTLAAGADQLVLGDDEVSASELSEKLDMARASGERLEMQVNAEMADCIRSAGFEFYLDQDMELGRQRNLAYLEGLRESERRRYTTTMFGDGQEVVVPLRHGEVTHTSSGCMADARERVYQDFSEFLAAFMDFEMLVVALPGETAGTEAIQLTPSELGVVSRWDEVVLREGLAS